MDKLLAPSKAISCIIQIMPDGESRTVYKKDKSKRRKSSKGLRRAEKIQRQVVQAFLAGNADYLKRHNKSSRKKKDGWVRDVAYNTARANEKAGKKLQKIRVI